MTFPQLISILIVLFLVQIQTVYAKHTLSFRILDEPETLDWNRAHTMIESYLLMNLMEGLVYLDSENQVQPALASHWNMSSDGKTYTFKLRAGVKWSDGVALRAEDFVYSWKRLLSPLTAASYSYLLFDIEGAELFHEGKLTDFSQVGVKALDSLTLQVKLIRPVSYWISIPAFWVTFPMRKDWVEKYGEGWDVPGKMVTLGPFRLMSHDLDSKYVLESNPNYYGRHGNLDQLIALIVKDDATAFQMYEAHQLDFLTDLGAIQLNPFHHRADLRAFSQLKTGYLGFVTDQYPLSDVKFRQALAMSIDRSTIQKILFGHQKPATSFVPPPLMSYSKRMGIPYNPSLGRAILEKSGFDLNSKFTIDYVLPEWDKSVKLAHWIKSELKKNLGIEINLRTFENKVYRAQLDLHMFPLFDATWTADYPDPDNFLSVFLSTSGNNRTTWKNKKYDQIVQEAKETFNPLQREKLYIQLQKILIEQEAVIIPLYYEPNLAFMSPRVKNLKLNSLDFLYMRNVDVIP